MAYWDTSALVKLYVDEPDSLRYRETLRANQEQLQTSMLTLAELYNTFWAKVAGGTLSREGPDALIQKIWEAVQIGRIRLVPYDRQLIASFQTIIATCYTRPEPLRLRSADGIHLASARSIAALELVCADHRMRVAAELLGFRLLPVTF